MPLPKLARYSLTVAVLCYLGSDVRACSEGEGRLYVFNNVPSYSTKILDTYGNLNFKRLGMDAEFGASLGVGDMDLFRGGAVVALASAEKLPANQDVNNCLYYQHLEEEAAAEQRNFSELFDADELKRLRNVSYRAFAAKNGLRKLFQLPAVQNAFSLNGEDSRSLDEAFGRHQRKLQGLIREHLEDGFFLLTSSMSFERESQMLQLLGVKDSEDEPLPLRLLEGVLRSDSPLQTPSEPNAILRAYQTQERDSDLLVELLINLKHNNFELSEAKQDELYGADAKFALKDTARNIQDSNAHVASVLDEAELRRLQAVPWLQLLDDVHFTEFFVHPRVVSELAISPSDAEELKNTSEKVALQVDEWLREVDTELKDLPPFAGNGAIGEFLEWYRGQ